MIRHVVLWKLKPEAAAPEVLAQNLAQIYRNCQRMVEEDEYDDEGEALVEAADDEGEYEEPDDDGYDDDEYEDEDDGEDADEEPSHKDPGIGGMFAAFKSEFDKAAKGE